MRSRFRVLTENNGEITGSWLRDRNDNSFENETAQMSDARRRAEIRKLAADFRDLIDRRKHPEREILRESEAIWEAIQEAVGDRNLKDMFSYLWGSEEDSDEWLAFRESHQDKAFNDIEQEDDEEPNF